MPFRPTRGRAASGVVAGVLVLSGCGGSDAPPAPAKAATATPTATPAPVSAALRGSWKRTMTDRAWKPAGKGYPLGTWRFTVRPNGDMDVYLPHKKPVDFTTQIRVKGDELTIEGIPICPTATGDYTWHASSDRLTLKVVADDDCVARAALFGGTWRRRG